MAFAGSIYDIPQRYEYGKEVPENLSMSGHLEQEDCDTQQLKDKEIKQDFKQLRLTAKKMVTTCIHCLTIPFPRVPASPEEYNRFYFTGQMVFYQIQPVCIILNTKPQQPVCIILNTKPQQPVCIILNTKPQQRFLMRRIVNSRN